MISSTRQRSRRPLGVLVVVAVTAALLAVTAVAGTPAAVAAYPVPNPADAPTATALPTVQTDGVVFSVAVVGDVVYAGGRFGRARPAGTPLGSPQEVVRTNLLAFRLSTGELLPWAPVVTGTQYTSTSAPDAFCRTVAAQTYVCDSVFRVKASPDGSRLYVGGDFSGVNGVGRQRVAAFDTAGGALSTTFRPAFNGRVRALSVTADAVYVGGDFTTVNAGTPRSRLAAVDTGGAVLPWAPTADRMVWSLLAVPAANKVIIGGNFNTINSTTVHGLEAVDLGGANAPWAYRSVPAGSVITDLVTDGSAVFASGYDYATSNSARFEGRMALELDTGARRWIAACFGDTQGLAVADGLVYSASHSHDCQYTNGHPQTSPSTYQRLMAETAAVGGAYQGGGNALVAAGSPIPAQVHWYPDTDGGPSNSYWKNGPWSVAATSDYVVYGGEFLDVNGAPQQSLVRFSTSAGPKAPELFGSPTATVRPDGTVRVAFSSTSDMDSPTLRYELLRSDAGAAPVATTTLTSAFWTTAPLTLTDRTLPAGATATYRVRAVDPTDQRTATGNSDPVTGTGPPAPLPGYPAAVAADRPLHHWRLGEASGTVLRDVVGGDDLTVRSPVLLGRPGALAGDADTAAEFGTGTSLASIGQGRYAPDAFSAEVWFSTTSTSGGQLLGWSSTTTGTSTTSDRKLYLDNAGRLHFGVNPGTRTTVSSSATYRDGAWHHAVATLGPDGMRLFVDGSQVAANPSVRLGQFTRTGYWRLGNDSLSGWPSQPATGNFAGRLDEAAVYGTPLPASAVAAHYAARLGSAPAAAFTSACSGLACTADGSGSTDADGTVTAHAWSWGDGGTSTGPAPAHTYAAAGTYPVTLTVTDSSGLTASVTHDVTATAAAPTAAITGGCTGLTCTVDASTSTPGSAPITGYAWDFGDGGAATGVSVSHTYAATGTYPVTLTVTDSAGATGTATVTASAQGTVVPGAIATDGFLRGVTGGWGTADTGGPWTVSTNAADYAVSGGSATITNPTAGSTRTATLGAVSAADLDLTVDVAQDRLPAAGSTYVYAALRQVAANTDYRARLRYQSDGSVRLQLVRRAGTTADVAIGTEVVVPGLSPTTPLRLRFQVSGSGTATLRAKVWTAGSPEPGTWQRSVTDATAALQAPGALALSVSPSSSNTGVPVVTVVRNLTVVAPQP